MPDPAPIPTGDTLGAWDGWWIEGRCRCRIAFLPCRLLAKRYGPGRRVADVVARLLCPRCRERPTIHGLVDDPRTDEVSARVYGPVQRVPVPGLQP